MAKKARKKTAAGRMKKSRKKSRSAPKRKKTIRKRRVKSAKRKNRGKIAGAYRAVVDSFKGTDRLRNKLEQPGTSESE